VRGLVLDKDFNVPLFGVTVTIIETGEKTKTTDEGNFLFPEVEPGQYTLVFSKEGYTRKVEADVVVSPSQMTDVDTALSGEFTEMAEFIVQDLQVGATETGLLMLRVKSPALLDSISAELLSQAGAGDAASALNLVAGATVEDGKFAVVRGLPDRYVNSQMNSVRLPTADPDKRAVHLDQFPSAVIESVQVSKTFTPDQQGDASGGAVNIVLKRIPDEDVLQVKAGYNYNTQVSGNDDFLSYEGGGVPFWGKDDGGRDIPAGNDFSGNTDALGISSASAPIDYNFSVTGGGKRELFEGVNIGGFGNFYYKRDSGFHDNGIDDSYWVDGDPSENSLTPEYGKGAPNIGADPQNGDFTTKLFDQVKAKEEVQLGGMATVGVEVEQQEVTVTYMKTRIAEDEVVLSEDTRGKEYYFEDYDVDDPTHPGNAVDVINSIDGRNAAPYLRQQTLNYTERITDTLQFSGDHTAPVSELDILDTVKILPPEFDWMLAFSSSELLEPDKRQFGAKWVAESYNAGFPPFIPEQTTPAVYYPLKPGSNINFGNVQRIWKEITEKSDQYSLNWRFPFEQWSGEEGYVKFGIFNDEVTRNYDQESFSNFGQPSSQYEGEWEEYFSSGFYEWDAAEEITDGSDDFLEFDVDYTGEQKISAQYYMVDLPFNSMVKLVGGVRYESTDLTIVNDPEPNAKYVTSENLLDDLDPGDADVAFSQKDMLPSYGIEITPFEQLKIRGSYSETVARQTFKEMTPIQQQEYLGGDIFMGNPELGMSALKNYDARIDYTPYEGGLVSFSWFKKDITDPIEYVKNAPSSGDFTYTTPVNFPSGQMNGLEFEVRQKMGEFWEPLSGLSVGGNLTLIESEVQLSEKQVDILDNVGIEMTSRPMLNAPEYLYNVFLTHEFERTGTKVSLFYTVKGDTLIVGAGQSNSNFIPAVYAKEYGTLNLTFSQDLGENFKLSFKIKNLTNPEIQEVYRSDYTDGDVVKTSYTKGIDFSLGISGKW
jgi:TonB-dependent receptor